jgi:hypothetical protein
MMIRSFYRILPLAVFAVLTRQEGRVAALVQPDHSESFANKNNNGLDVPNRRAFISNVAVQ